MGSRGGRLGAAELLVSQDLSCILHGRACVCRDRRHEPGDKTSKLWDGHGAASARPRAPRPHCKLEQRS